MTKLPEEITRKNVLEFISKSASYGNLGAFVGAGFSKAVLNDGIHEIALSWGDLLEDVADKLELDYTEIEKEGVGYPEIASRLCEEYSSLKGVSYKDASLLVKRKIASLTSWYPNKEQRAVYSAHLGILNCSWFITTNYDLIIESLLTGKSTTLGPNDPLVAPKGIVPVYHLHGARTNPDDIIITQEDYVGLFRPTEYRQIKLALMIKESTMIILGYGLGDVNVLTALDWSRNVFNVEEENYPNEVIQILYARKPKKKPYRDKNSVIVVEIDDLEEFFEEFKEVRHKTFSKEEKRTKSLNKLLESLDDSKISTVDKFIDDQEFRHKTLDTLSEFPNDLISGFVSFLDRCIDKTWERAKPDGAFEAYAENLNIILDILVELKFEQMPPALFQITAEALNRVGYYISFKHGRSHPAARLWRDEKGNIPDEMIRELKAFAQQHQHYDIQELIKDL